MAGRASVANVSVGNGDGTAPVVPTPADADSGLPTETAGETGPSAALVLLLAIVCGAAVANIYYAQPLLPVIGTALGVGEGTTALLVTASQIGYALALALVVPLGDLLERRRLVTLMLGLTAVFLLGAMVAPTFAVLLVALGVVAVTSSVAQIVVPMAASLATDADRGRVVGTVMSGLLIGILAARTVGGLIAHLGGWRSVFGVAAVLMLVLAIAVRCALPRVEPTTTVSYPALLGSVLRLVRDEPVLRQRMVLGAIGMGGFTLLWTAISFLLAGPGFGYGPAAIGLFGLAGLAGAAMAPVTGRIADRGHSRLVITLGLAALLVSWVLLGLGGLGATFLIALIAGIVLLDLAQQSLQISHQSAIYALAPEARSRVTTAFIVSAFVGGTIASAMASALYPYAGWTGVCVFGGALVVVGLAFWLITERRFRLLSDRVTRVPDRGVPAGRRPDPPR